MADHTLKLLDEIEARAKRAHDEIAALCLGPRSAKGREWTMHIPARPDRDSDLVLDAAVRDVDALAAFAREVLSDSHWQWAQDRQARNGVAPCQCSLCLSIRRGLTHLTGDGS